MSSKSQQRFKIAVVGATGAVGTTMLEILAERDFPAVTETLLLDFQERLIKSGLFEGVNVVLDPDPSRAADARIVARLREAPLQVSSGPSCARPGTAN